MKYRLVHAQMRSRLEEMEETGVIPNAEMEGAPTTLEAARHAFLAGIVAVEQIIQDLTILQMESAFE